MRSDLPNNLPLVRSVLHPTDFSQASNRAFAHALGIALLRQTKFTILHVGPEKERDIEWSKFPPVRKTLERWGLLEADSPESAVYKDLQVRVSKAVVKGRDPVKETTKFLEAQPFDLLVLSTDGREGVARLVDRCDAEAMARESRTMTLFVPSDAKRGMISLDTGDTHVKNILVPVDTDPDASTALEFSRRVAEVLGDEQVTITLLHVGESPPPTPDLEDGPEWKWQIEHRQGDPVEEILGAAEAVQADLVVMATAGREGVLDAMRGSTTEQVVRGSPCPLLAVPEGYTPRG